jgi:predicted RNase H-like nuclease (RuvC/YqgF family)
MYTMLVEMCREDRKLTITRFGIVTLYIKNITTYGSKGHSKELHQHTVHLTKTVLEDKEVNKSQVDNMSKEIVVLKEEVQKLKEKQDKLKKEQTIINTEVRQELRVQNQRITEVDNKYQEELSKMQLQTEQQFQNMLSQITNVIANARFQQSMQAQYQPLQFYQPMPQHMQ